ncbi:MAG TPA: DUF423 domain-containing protein [Hanamia sp.]|nr:DUF423 domain-containing protein [Hanamia sp.]
MNKGFLKIAALLGAFSVALGAFGAHALKGRLTVYAIEIFETAVKYQFYHVFALLAVGILYKDFPGKLLNWAGRLFIAGIILFSGSLYCLAVVKGKGISGFDWLGAITPFGGLCFIIGWMLLFARITAKPAS